MIHVLEKLKFKKTYQSNISTQTIISGDKKKRCLMSKELRILSA